VNGRDFALKDADGKMWTLADFRGKTVVLYFYPKDNTPGCTTEACSFRDRYEEFKKRGVEVVGVSADSEKSHKSFAEKQIYPFSFYPIPRRRRSRRTARWEKGSSMAEPFSVFYGAPSLSMARVLCGRFSPR